MEDKLSVAVGAVRVERDPVWFARILFAADACDQALTVGLDFNGDSEATVLATSATRPPAKLPPIHGGVPGASGPLGRCALVYMDDCLVHSPTLEQHLLDVEEVL